MPRGTELSDLLVMLKAELGHSLTTGVATAQDVELKKLLSDMQQWLRTQYEWPFLYTREDVTTESSTRFYDLPTTIDLDYPTRVEVKWGQRWFPILWGISGEQYSISDSETGSVTRDPILRWQVSPTDATQFEVWPLPTSALTLRFYGYGVLPVLDEDDDTAVLDDLLLVLFTAAEKLTRAKLSDAPNKLQRAQALFTKLRNANREDTVFQLNAGNQDYEFCRKRRKILTIVGNTANTGTEGILLLSGPDPL